MKFAEVAVAFNDIEATSGRTEITKRLAHLFGSATPDEANIIANLSIGQLQPPYIGTQFNLAQKSLIPIVADFVGETQKGIESQLKKYGDLGDVLAQYTWKARENLTVAQVYRALSDLEKISGTGSQDEKAKALALLLDDLDPLSAKYAVRIITGKLRLGFSDMTVIDALSWMEAGDKSLRATIEDAYNIRADIGLIAQELKKNGIAALKNMKMQVGIPVLPAAAERLPTAQAIIEKIGECIAQPKLDGFRLQIHVDKTIATPQIHFFSRNLQDMSAMFPDLVDACANLKIDTLICEGEAIVYNPETGDFLPFQETVKRKRKHGIEKAAEALPLRVFLFDILYLNGKSLLNLTTDERRDKLRAIAPVGGDAAIQTIDEKHITTAEQLETYFNEMISAGLEGLVVKRIDAIYQPGKRNFNWIKLKRRAQGHLEDTLDCVVLGYYGGAGKRVAFGIGAFLVGVFNKKEDLFETIAKVGTGLTDDEWRELKKKCDARALKEQPHNVVCPKELKPDVWVDPAIICSILADEITMSPTHTAGKTKNALGYALRFPRFMGYRPDKGPFEATTVHEVKRLYEDQFKK